MVSPPVIIDVADSLTMTDRTMCHPMKLKTAESTESVLMVDDSVPRGRDLRYAQSGFPGHFQMY
jgi:hypothetical protein